MGKAEREAGKRAERDARDRLKPLWSAIRRGLGQSIGALEADLEETPLRWEVKCWSKWPSVEDALAQLKRDAERWDDPRPRAVVHKKKKKTEWRVTFELSEFIRFVEGMR